MAALVGIFALVGIIVQSRLQLKELRAARIEEHRRRHQELRELSMSDPVLMACWGGLPMASASAFPEKRQFQYMHLLFLSWLTSQRVGLPTWDLEIALESVFEGKPGRDYWEFARPTWQVTYTSRCERALIDLIDRSYDRACAKGAPKSTADLLTEMGVAPVLAGIRPPPTRNGRPPHRRRRVGAS
ncbi:DUF6082 family protein [Nocardia sp. NPDC051832]|uniref:DUF6082 family protein n=1 Tax=Nocardia sp. NPDC051832 TaxID=3155673 RepID=UPI00341E9654